MLTHFQLCKFKLLLGQTSSQHKCAILQIHFNNYLIYPVNVAIN